MWRWLLIEFGMLYARDDAATTDGRRNPFLLPEAVHGRSLRRLPSFVGILGFLIPLVAIVARPSDAINGEHNRPARYHAFLATADLSRMRWMGKSISQSLAALEGYAAVACGARGRSGILLIGGAEAVRRSRDSCCSWWWRSPNAGLD